MSENNWTSVWEGKPPIGEEVLVWHAYGDFCGTEGVSIDTWAPHPQTGELMWASEWGAKTMGGNTHWQKMIVGPSGR